MQNSIIHANKQDDKLIKACAEAVEELKAARKLLGFTADERAAAAEMYKVQKQLETELRGLVTLSEQKTEMLTKLLDLANQQLSIKDQQLKNKDDEISAIKKQKSFSFTSKVFLVLIGIGIGSIVAAVK